MGTYFDELTAIDPNAQMVQQIVDVSRKLGLGSVHLSATWKPGWGGSLPVGIPTPVGWGGTPPAWWPAAKAAIIAHPELTAAIFQAAPNAAKADPGVNPGRTVAPVTIINDQGKAVGAAGMVGVRRVGAGLPGAGSYSAAGPPPEDLGEPTVTFTSDGGFHVIPPPPTTATVLKQGNNNMLLLAIAVAFGLAVMR